VRDDGTGLPEGWQTNGIREGVGLGNTRRRLEQLYNGKHRLELRDVQGGGSEVTLEIPYRTEEAN
jgi:LytS/YehU family sensor histidine kinase